jgi:3-methyladenine DNA glycosylase AlkD
MTSAAAGWVTGVRTRLEAVADAARAPAMQAYMKDVAPFLGVPAPVRRAAVRPLGRPDDGDLPDVCRALWAEPEREFAYVACDWLAQATERGPAGLITVCEELIRSRSWWDTVDPLASCVGNLVARHAELVDLMDRWIVDEDMWVARAAILHQLGLGLGTDEERLYRLCITRAADTRFFIRKAIGWALRDYAWHNPTSVRTFVAVNSEIFSTRTIREATKNLDR